MSGYTLSNIERETIICYNNEEKTADVYTCDKRMMTKLDALCEKHPDMFQLKRQDQYSKSYVLPKQLIGIRTPRTYTEEQKQVMSERGKAMQANLAKFVG